jgi:hypothetical protein
MRTFHRDLSGELKSQLRPLFRPRTNHFLPSPSSFKLGALLFCRHSYEKLLLCRPQTEFSTMFLTGCSSRRWTRCSTARTSRSFSSAPTASRSWPGNYPEIPRYRASSQPVSPVLTTVKYNSCFECILLYSHMLSVLQIRDGYPGS